MQKLANKKQINIQKVKLEDFKIKSQKVIKEPTELPNPSTKVKIKKYRQIGINLIRLLLVSVGVLATYFATSNLYLVSLSFYFFFLVLFLSPQEILLAVCLLVVVLVITYITNYSLYYFKMGEFIFVGLLAATLRMSGILFTSKNTSQTP